MTWTITRECAAELLPNTKPAWRCKDHGGFYNEDVKVAMGDVPMCPECCQPMQATDRK